MFGVLRYLTQLLIVFYHQGYISNNDKNYKKLDFRELLLNSFKISKTETYNTFRQILLEEAKILIENCTYFKMKINGVKFYFIESINCEDSYDNYNGVGSEILVLYRDYLLYKLKPHKDDIIIESIIAKVVQEFNKPCVLIPSKMFKI